MSDTKKMLHVSVTKIVIALIIGITITVTSCIISYHWKEVRLAESGLYYMRTPRANASGSWLPRDKEIPQ